MANISIGLRNDNSIDVDLQGDDDEWGYSNVTVEEAEFMVAELSAAIQRAKAYRARRQPQPPADAEGA